jgi:hypothetical protein
MTVPLRIQPAAHALSPEAATAPVVVPAAPSPAEFGGIAFSERGSSERDDGPSERVDGRAAAAVIAAGVGCAAFGVAVVVAESVTAVKKMLTLSAAAGPLSGKAVVAVVIYAIFWLLLHLALRRTQTKITTVGRLTIVLLVIGLLGTFPPFYGLIAGH